MISLDLDYRKEIARQLLSYGRTNMDDINYIDLQLLGIELKDSAKLAIAFPGGLAPVPAPIDPKPPLDAALPKADVVIITWTVAENDALADVLTPRYSRATWYRYTRYFEQKYAPQIRKGAPAYSNRRLGSYFMTSIDDMKVLCFKSELHLNQDGIRDYQSTGQTSLPVRDLIKQIIQETRCSYIISVGTCGAIREEHDLGDVLVTRAAKFRCTQEFQNATFSQKKYISKWNVPTAHFAMAEKLMESFAKNLKEPIFGPPTKRHDGGAWILSKAFMPSIIHEAGEAYNKLPEFHPILTTDYFEFGHSRNAEELWAEGCGVEMGDAVLGLVCEEDLTDPPKWLVIRNLSDPQINGDITATPRSLNMQVHWAVWYYETYGYWTSIMSALTTWAVVAGLQGA